MSISEKTEIVCVGQVLVDCIIKGWDPAAEGGGSRAADSITLSPGGDAYNEAVIFSRLGHPTMVLCGLGDDVAGEILRHGFQENGIVLPPQTDRGIQTLVSCLIVNGQGGRRSLLTPLHGRRQYELDMSLLKGKKLVSLASLFRAPLVEPELLLELCRAAKAEGAILSADTKISLSGSPSFEELKPIMPYIDYFFPNVEEAAYYTGKTDVREMAEVFLSCGVGHVLIKLGKDGCYVRDSEVDFFCPACEVEAVDATGAGDNFAAGVLSSILRGKTLQEAVVFGTCCAAVCVQSIGATSGVKDRMQIEEVVSRCFT